MALVTLLSGCLFGPSRERAIKDAILHVKETMDVALPDVAHPEPYKYEDAGDCAWVPELPSSKESLRYQVEVPLPDGDDGHARQERAAKHWIEKGGKLRTMPHQSVAAAEVDYDGGSILVFAMPDRRTKPGEQGRSMFYIVATTPCIAKEN